MNATHQTAAKPEFKGFRIYHVWSKVWPSPNRRYEGVCWAFDEYEAGTTARTLFGNGKIFDIQTEKRGGLVRKGA